LNFSGAPEMSELRRGCGRARRLQENWGAEFLWRSTVEGNF